MAAVRRSRSCRERVCDVAYAVGLIALLPVILWALATMEIEEPGRW